jgi:putative nucleotidyltransferase-like protein
VRERGLVGAFWPSRRERLVLQTVLAEPARALASWQELRLELDIQTLEDTAFGALPLVYRRLETMGVDDPDLPRLKGIYRHTWVTNNLLLERLQATAEVLRAADVPMLLVGTIGAAVRYYDTLGLRPTGYLSVLVKQADWLQAIRALGGAGWSTRGGSRPPGTAPLPLFDDAGRVCLLRTRLAPEFVQAGEPAEAAFWDAAVDVDLDGLQIRALPPTDDLLAIVITGARANRVPSLQWIVDSAMIVRTPEQIDWQHLYRISVEGGQGLRLRDALLYLGGLLGYAPAPTVVEQLERRSPSRRERLVHATMGTDVPWLGSLPDAVGEHLAATAGTSAWATAGAFPAFLRERWQVPSSRQLPAAVGRRAVRTLRGRRGSTEGSV